MISYSILRDMNKNVLRDSVEKILTVNAKSQNNSNNNRRKKIMARLFMAGVASVDMFDGAELFGTANTLTESSLNIGISAEDVRGGEGAGLLGKYYHTSTFDLTLTDALFNLKYIGASIGADFESEPGKVVFNEEIKATETGKLTLTNKAVSVLGCDGAAEAWYKLPDADEYSKGSVSGTTLSADDIVADKKYCVKYFYKEAAGQTIKVKSDYVPKTLHLVLKENLYAAGENNNNTTKVGYLVIDIPRFQLDGTQELSMSMTGAATTSLKGSALISDGCDSGCDGSGYYAEMTQVLTNAKWYDGINSLAVDGGEVVAGKAISLYAIFANRTPKKVTDDMLEGLTLTADEAPLDGLTAPAEAKTYALVLKNGAEEIASGSMTVIKAE